MPEASNKEGILKFFFDKAFSKNIWTEYNKAALEFLTMKSNFPEKYKWIQFAVNSATILRLLCFFDNRFVGEKTSWDLWYQDRASPIAKAIQSIPSSEGGRVSVGEDIINHSAEVGRGLSQFSWLPTEYYSLLSESAL